MPVPGVRTCPRGSATAGSGSAFLSLGLVLPSSQAPGVGAELRLGRDTQSHCALAGGGPAEETGLQSETVTGQHLPSGTHAGALSPVPRGWGETGRPPGPLGPWPAALPCLPGDLPGAALLSLLALHGQGWCPQSARGAAWGQRRPRWGGPPRSLTAPLSAGHLSCGWRGRWLYGRFR